MYKIDLHTHSIVSHDGGISFRTYERLLKEKRLDYIAVTDHNSIEGARRLAQTLGEKIIVGEEIKSTEGEITGLFLTEAVSAGLNVQETVARIKEQGGLIYIPHPFERQRHGLNAQALNKIAADIDIMETFNARGWFRGQFARALSFAQTNNLSMASSSDAHCFLGIPSAFSIVDQPITKDNLAAQLHQSKQHQHYASPLSYLCPTINRFRSHQLS